MSKPKLKGATVGVRLPLSVDAAVRARASGAGVSPSEYLTRMIVRALDPGTVQGESNKRTMPTDAEFVAACAHKVRVPIAGGLVRCRTCSMVRGADGTWR